MAKKGKSFFKGLSFNIILAVTLLIVTFGTVVGIIGYVKFTDSLTEQYNDSAFRTAETAAVLINGDSVKAYLKEENIEPINAYFKAYDLEPQPDLKEEKAEIALSEYMAEQGYSEERKEEVIALAKEYTETVIRTDTLCEKQNVTIIYSIAVNTTDYESFVSLINCVNNTRYTRWYLGEEKYTTKTDDNSYERIYKDIYENGLKRDKIVRENNLNGAPSHITSLIPITDSTGEVVAILCVQRLMEELNEGRTRYVSLVAGLTFGLAVFFILIFVWHTRRQFVKPIRKIVDEAERFAKENSTADESFNKNVGYIDEIKTLANSVTHMEKDIVNYIGNLSQVIGDRQKIVTELKIAELIQEGSLPSIFPAYPDIKEFDLYAMMKPVKEIGGDFYDFFLIDDDHLALVMADVSGKGIGAALFMMVTKILINEITLSGGSPAEILKKVNDRICNNNKAEMFVTVWLGIMTISTGEIVYANAGHDDPAIYTDKGEFKLLKEKHGFVIGGMKGVAYKNNTVTLNKGDKIFLYTDGLPEATAKDGNMFKITGMMDALNKHKEDTPKAVIEGIWQNVSEFMDGENQFDDLTMLCLSYQGKEKNDAAKMDVPANEENLHAVLEFIEEQATERGLSLKAINQIKIAAEEIFVNICKYAYGTGTGETEISVYENEELLCVCFTDSGVEYNPLEKPDPDVKAKAEDRQIGGLGIYMAKKLTDGISYERKDGKNILIMEKRIWKN